VNRRVSNLREIIRVHVEEQSLREYYQAGYASTSTHQRDRTLGFLRSRGLIDQEVQKIVDGFISQVDKKNRKRRRLLNIGLVAINILVTPLIGYAVNEKQWTYVWGISVLFLLISVFYIILNDE
jgi:hypothetical protein